MDITIDTPPSVATAESPYPNDMSPSYMFERVLLAASPVLLPFFTTTEATVLRCVSRLFLEVVTEWHWEDLVPEEAWKWTAKTITMIKGPVDLWRRCFPRARTANVVLRSNLTLSSMATLRGVRTLCASESNLDNKMLRAVFEGGSDRGLRVYLSDCPKIQ